MGGREPRLATTRLQVMKQEHTYMYETKQIKIGLVVCVADRQFQGQKCEAGLDI